MKNREKLTGNLFAIFTIAIWGSTFIASKKLLAFYTPARISTELASITRCLNTNGFPPRADYAD